MIYDFSMELDKRQIPHTFEDFYYFLMIPYSNLIY